MKDNSYKKQWLAIDSLILEKSLPKTALKKVNLLYTDAKTKGLKDQVIKALLYKMSLQSQVNDEDPNIQITALQKEITNTQEIVLDLYKDVSRILATTFFRYIYEDESIETSDIHFVADGASVAEL